MESENGKHLTQTIYHILAYTCSCTTRRKRPIFSWPVLLLSRKEASKGLREEWTMTTALAFCLPCLKTASDVARRRSQRSRRCGEMHSNSERESSELGEGDGVCWMPSRCSIHARMPGASLDWLVATGTTRGHWFSDTINAGLYSLHDLPSTVQDQDFFKCTYSKVSDTAPDISGDLDAHRRYLGQTKPNRAVGFAA